MTSWGETQIAMATQGVAALAFGLSSADWEAQLRAWWPKAQIVESVAATQPWIERIFLEQDVVVPLFLQGTPFQLRVWDALRQISIGTVVTYGELARQLQVPNAVRAVANAVAANKIAYCIPCHRVVHANSRQQGYRWGVALKTALLQAEQAGLIEKPEQI